MTEQHGRSFTLNVELLEQIKEAKQLRLANQDKAVRDKQLMFHKAKTIKP